MSYCSVGAEGVCLVLFFFVFCKFQPSDQAFPAFFDQVILLGRHPLVIIKTVCWVFLSCQCYGSLCKLICSSQCLSFVKQYAWFFRFLLWPWFTLQIYIISLCGSCVSKIFWLRQKMGSYVGFCLQSWMMWTWIGRSVVRFGIWIGARMARFCKQSDVSSDDVSSDRKVVSERLELRRRIQICRYCNPFLSAPTPSQDEKRNKKNSLRRNVHSPEVSVTRKCHFSGT